MSRAERKAAAQELTEARESLSKSDRINYAQRNERVVNAEKNVRLGRVRGWDYVDENDD